MQSTNNSSSDIEEEIWSPDKNNYTLLVHNQDKLTNCTKLSGNQETEYPKTYYQVVRFLDHSEANSDILPGSKYHNRTIFRVSFYQEIKYSESKTMYQGHNPVNYTDKRRPMVQFNTHVPTVLGDFPIDKFVHKASAN
jgi:hypothetical protein